MKKGKCKNGHCSSMSNSAWCGLNSKGDSLKLHDISHNPKCKGQKGITFTPKQLQLEGSGFTKTRRKIFKGRQKAWNSFLEPTINTPAPVIGMAVGANSKNPQVVQATANFLKSL